MTTALLTSDSIEMFLNSLRAQGIAENTCRAYKSDLRELMKMAPLAATTLELETQMANFLNMRRTTHAPKTIRRYLTSFRTYGEYLGTSLLPKYKTPKPARPTPKPLPNGMADVAAILGVTTCPKKRALVVLCGRAGLRVSEAVAVTPADVKTDDSGTPWITVMGKGAKQRRVPLGPDSWEIFKPAYVEAVVNKTTVVGFQERRARQIITDLAAQAKVSRRVSSHNLRATFLTDVLERTKDLAAAQDLAGHSSPETTRIYTETSEARMKEAVETL